MGKGAPVLTNSLYKISDKIAQAAKDKNGVTEPVNQPEPPSAPAAPEKPVKKELTPERIQEFNRMYHDMEIRTEGMTAEFQSELELLAARKQELSKSAEIIEKLKHDLEQIALPDENEPEPDKHLSKSLRALELMRLEAVRQAKKMDASKSNTAGNGQNSFSGADLINTPNSEIMKKGFAFFFPLFLALLFCTVLMGLSFIFAWKVAL